ncbi:MAG: amidase [Candidatus Thermoplasmatota archaeon]|nr:amidase [Candidatus Thermoplasmatota archaeon]
MAVEFIHAPASETIQNIKSGYLTPSEIIEALIHRIERLDVGLGAYSALNHNILEEARELESGLNSGNMIGQLSGLPIAVKDIFDTKGIPTSYGSKIFSAHIPEKDAIAVKNIKKNGGLIIGKTTTHEFALSIITPECRNPWDTDRIPGGSSGGSAAAVAAGLAICALGTDTGGSIRIPASMCGVTGMKPTYGAIDTFGVFPEAPSLDHVGIICRYASDLPVLLEATGMKIRQPGIMRGKTARAGILSGFLERCKIPVKNKFLSQIDRIVSENICEIGEIQLNDLEVFQEALNVIDEAESSYIHRTLFPANRDKYMGISAEQIESGTLRKAHEYLWAKSKQAELKNYLKQIFRNFDFLMLPTQPDSAPSYSDAMAMKGKELGRYLEFTDLFNMSGNPAISIPCGFISDMPVGLQIVGKVHHDAEVIDIASSFQNVTYWHKMYNCRFK